MLWLICKLTRGRPMTMVRENYFRDRIDGRMVHIYQDYFGRYWLAHSAWGLFRVPCGAPM